MKVTPVGKKFGKYAPGESFDLPDKTAKIFIKLGKLAKLVNAIEPAPVYMTRMLQAEPVKSEAAPYGYKADGTPRQRPGRPAKSE